MALKTCEIRECGATVKLVSIGGKPFAVNPKKVELVTADSEGIYHIVSGYQPHHETCVNIGDRLARRGRARA